MKLFFLDDSTQRTCSRQRIDKLVAVGGIIIEADKARVLELAIDEICLKKYGFPPHEPFKWSPNKDHWMRENLIEQRRTDFYREVLSLAKEHGVIGQVCIADPSKNFATKTAKSSEMDVLSMAMERFDWLIPANDQGMVIVARPSGGRKDEDHFLAECVEIVTVGTDYSKFKRLATNVLTMPFHNSRLLQIADLVVSITTAIVAGHSTFAGEVFPAVKELLNSSSGRIGGVGLKIHPDYSYLNLYHWVLGDRYFMRFQNGWDLPMEGRPFFKSENEY